MVVFWIGVRRQRGLLQSPPARGPFVLYQYVAIGKLGRFRLPNEGQIVRRPRRPSTPGATTQSLRLGVHQAPRPSAVAAYPASWSPSYDFVGLELEPGQDELTRRWMPPHFSYRNGICVHVCWLLIGTSSILGFRTLEITSYTQQSLLDTRPEARCSDPRLLGSRAHISDIRPGYIQSYAPIKVKLTEMIDHAISSLLCAQTLWLRTGPGTKFIWFLASVSIWNHDHWKMLKIRYRCVRYSDKSRRRRRDGLFTMAEQRPEDTCLENPLPVTPIVKSTCISAETHRNASIPKIPK